MLSLSSVVCPIRHEWRWLFGHSAGLASHYHRCGQLGSCLFRQVPAGRGGASPQAGAPREGHDLHAPQ